MCCGRAGGLGASGRAGASSAAYDKMGLMALHLATTDEGNALLERDPVALLLGMQLDQQIPMEKAFTSPSVLAERMGADHLDAATIAALPPETLLEYFRTPPALHRFPGSMAQRTQQLCQAIVDEWDGDAANIWSGAESGVDLVKRIGSLPGFGDQEGEDLRGAARQAVRRDPAGLAGGDRRLRPAGAPLDRGRRRRRVARQGAGVQEGEEGRTQGLSHTGTHAWAMSRPAAAAGTR